jgi:hypothetical protein
MDVYKAIYNNGAVELIEPCSIKEKSEVYVIFPEKKKKNLKIGGLFKDSKIDYQQVEKDLKQLNKQAELHLMKELGN